MNFCIVFEWGLGILLHKIIFLTHFILVSQISRHDCPSINMIKKLSDTWRQQKHRPTNNQDVNRRNQSKTHLGKNVASSLLRPSNGNYDDKAAPDEVMVSPPVKVKGDTMVKQLFHTYFFYFEYTFTIKNFLYSGFYIYL